MLLFLLLYETLSTLIKGGCFRTMYLNLGIKKLIPLVIKYY